ncbi:hypothetical protein PLICRDRAFT_176309 [Plicaturopsis crispa FD-325 SS-3]|nr:hypothetical protein PLICRDRAFT_176309 [Plicaturopsis crispa FD-325 SS-3]
MASSRSLNSPNVSSNAPPPTQFNSPAFPSMPNVFVIPPDEEQPENQPWCCFDAGNGRGPKFSTSPDMDSLDVAVTVMHQDRAVADAPTFHRSSGEEDDTDVVMPRKRSRPESVVSFHIDQSQEDVIEVVKVGRRDGTQVEEDDAAHRIKRSKTFVSRASKAFKSIKNIGKGSTRKHAKDAWPSRDSTSSVSSRAQSYQEGTADVFTTSASAPTLSRRKSLALSLFSPRELSLDRGISNENCPIEFTPPDSPTRAQDPSNVSDSLVMVDEPDLPPPTATLSTPRTTRRRFSLLELHRVFSFSPTAPTDAPGDSSPPSSTSSTASTPLPHPPSLFHDGPGAASSSTDALSERPETPQDDDMYVDDEQVTPKGGKFWRPHGVEPPEDYSLEMRLDSLHFDSLSFDAEGFDVSLG